MARIRRPAGPPGSSKTAAGPRGADAAPAPEPTSASDPGPEAAPDVVEISTACPRSPPSRGAAEISAPPPQPPPSQEGDDGVETAVGPEEPALGDPEVGPDLLRARGSLWAARHLMTLLARRRGAQERAAIIDEAASLLVALDDPPLARRLLLEMAEVGRIVDVYPLEVLVEVMHRTSLPRLAWSPLVLNKAALAAGTVRTDEVARIRVPLDARVRAFAIEGGLTPGYCFVPGPPGCYHLQVDRPGALVCLLRADRRRSGCVDRFAVTIVEPPEGKQEW